MNEAVHVVFDGPPGHESGRFVECETPDGRSINAGEWHERADGLWELRVKLAPTAIPSDTRQAIATSLYDAMHTARLSEHPEDEEQFGKWADGLVRWLGIQGYAIVCKRTIPTDAVERLQAWLDADDPMAEPQVERDVRTLLAALSTDQQGVDQAQFQRRVGEWMEACFTPEIIADKLERADRFIEEALELVQATGYSADRAHALVDYVFGRDIGEPSQEVGGVMVTLAALCNPHGLDMAAVAETELARIWTKIDKIRAKQATKPVGSALSIPDQQGVAADVTEALTPSAATKAAYHGEFTFDVEDGESDAGIERFLKVYVPWTTVKEIMAAIRDRAALSAKQTGPKP